MRGSKGSCLLALLVMLHSTLLTPECTCNVSGHFPRSRVYGDGDAGTLPLLQPATLLHPLGHSSRSPGSMHIPPFQNSLPGTAMASTCLVPHCRDTGSWADSLQEVGAPVLEWGSLSCSISFPLVTRIPAPPVSFLGICHEESCEGNGDHDACPPICFSVLGGSRAHETSACSLLLGQWEWGQGKMMDCSPCTLPHSPILSSYRSLEQC